MMTKRKRRRRRMQKFDITLAYSLKSIYIVLFFLVFQILQGKFHALFPTAFTIKVILFPNK